MIKELEFIRQSGSVATPLQVAAFEAQFQLRLPKALIEFCVRWNGGLPRPINQFYQVPKSFELFHGEYPKGVGIMVDGLYGLAGEHSRYDLEKTFVSLGDLSAIAMLPISFDLLGNYVVLRADALEGLVYWWDHELWEGPERPYLIPIAPDLASFYNGLTNEPLANY